VGFRISDFGIRARFAAELAWRVATIDRGTSSKRQLTITTTAITVALCVALGVDLRIDGMHATNADDSTNEPNRRVPQQLTHDGQFKERPVWSPDGKQVLFTRHRGGKIGLVAMQADGSAETPLTTGKLPQYDACWSPDGSRIAFTHVSQSGTQGNLDVYLAKSDGSDPALFMGDQGKLSHEEYPAWSPDGKRIAWTSTFEGNQEIYAADVDRSNRVRVTSDAALDAHPAWSPDSKQLAFASNRWGDLEIALADADGGNVTRLTESRGLDDYPVFSADGKRLAFTSNRDGNYEIHVMDLGDRSVRNVTQNPALDNFPAWTPDGRLAFVSNRNDRFEIYVLAIE
jgi:TolB protein